MNMDRRIQFLRALMSDDGLTARYDWRENPDENNHGQPVWAEKRDVSDGEKLRAAEVQASITCRFRVRWSEFTSEITPRDRIFFEGRTFDITGIKELDRRRMLEITAAARADQWPQL